MTNHQSSWREVRVTIPTDVVDLLRQELYTEITLASQALETAGSSAQREQHRQWFREPKQRLDEAYALLDILHWSRTTPPTELEVDLHGCGWRLLRALGDTLDGAEANLSEKTRRHIRERTSAAEQQCVSILRDLINTVQAAPTRSPSG